LTSRRVISPRHGHYGSGTSTGQLRQSVPCLKKLTGSLQSAERTHIDLDQIKNNCCFRGEPKIFCSVLGVAADLLFFGERHVSQEHKAGDL
jgi:hypothetical protein